MVQLRFPYQIQFSSKIWIQIREHDREEHLRKFRMIHNHVREREENNTVWLHILQYLTLLALIKNIHLTGYDIFVLDIKLKS